MAGAFLAYWSVRNFRSLASYQVFLCLLPLCYGTLMTRVDTFINWEESDQIVKVRTFGAIIVAASITIFAANLLIKHLLAPN